MIEYWRRWVVAAVMGFCLAGPGWAQEVTEEEPAEEPAVETGRVKLNFSGHLRPIVVWETIDFGELGPPPRNRFTAVGARTKLRMEGRLDDKARLFSSFILDFTEVEQGPYTASTSSELGRLRMLNSYVEIFGGSTTWRAGSQIQYWGNFPGLEKPTDRFNPKDFAYKSRELEDGKLPETGLEFIWGFSAQSLSLMYIPVPKVNKLHPNQIRFLDFLGYPEENIQYPPVESNRGKYVARLSGDVGDLYYALSYIDGVNPRPDLDNDGYSEPYPETSPFERRIEQAENGRAVYHRYRTPAIDLLYRAGGIKWIAGAVSYDTSDTANGLDPLRQNDWYEWMAGPEIPTGFGLWDFFIGQKIVPHVDAIPDVPADPDDPDNPARRRQYFQNALLDQPRERTDMFLLKYRKNFAGDRLEFSQDFAWYLDKDGEQVRFGSRTDLGWYLNEAHTLTARVRPGYFQNQEIVNQEIMAEVQLDF
jgi:hypothetical protein